MWGDSIFWLVALAVFIIVEGLTTALVSVWFAVGAIAALLLSLTPIGFNIQLLVFAVVSGVALAIMVPRLAQRRTAHKPQVTNGSPLTIGKQGVVLRDVEPGTLGRVRVDGLDWQARCDTLLPQGSKCQVVDVDGFILIVTPVVKTADSAVPAMQDAEQ